LVAVGVVVLFVVVFGLSSLFGDMVDTAAGGNDGEARARQTAETFLDAAVDQDGDTSWAMMSEAYRVTNQTRDFFNIMVSVSDAAKGRTRHFDKFDTSMNKVAGQDGVWMVYATFEYRSDRSDDTMVCLVQMFDPAQIDDDQQRGEELKIHGAGCGDKDKLDSASK
jgi:hypothetical protein